MIQVKVNFGLFDIKILQNMCIFDIVGIFYDDENYDLIFVIIGYLNYILDNLKV